MKLTRLLATFGLTLLLAACGGGGSSSSDNSPSNADPRWDRYELDFGAASVGSTTVRTAVLTNESGSAASYTSFGNLPAGVTATGCATVAAGASCTVTFTYAPTVVGSAALWAHPTVATNATMRIRVAAIDAALYGISLYSSATSTDWVGSLSIPGLDDAPLIVRAIQVTDAGCSVTVQGAYLTEMAGAAFDFGVYRLTIPAQGTMSTAGNVTTTTFTQPAEQGKCNIVQGRPDPGYAALDLVY